MPCASLGAKPDIAFVFITLADCAIAAWASAYINKYYTRLMNDNVLADNILIIYL